MSSAISEHRRLFNFNKSRCSTKAKGKAASKKKEPTCKLKFVCLAETTATAPPSNVKDKTDLCNAGLGDCSLQLDLNESSVYLYEEILKKFPQLAHTGGYELSLYQRGGGINGGFHAIKPPLTTIRLKDICAQAKIYIRPLQTDIPLLDEETQEENDEVRYLNRGGFIGGRCPGVHLLALVNMGALGRCKIWFSFFEVKLKLVTQWPYCSN